MAAAQDSRRAEKRATAPESTTMPIFVDPSGRRRRWVRRGALAVGTLLVGYLALVSIAATGRPGLLPILVPGAATQRHHPSRNDVPHERLTVPTGTRQARTSTPPSTAANGSQFDPTRSVTPFVPTPSPSRLLPTPTLAPTRTTGPINAPKPSHRPSPPAAPSRGGSHTRRPHPPHPSKPSTGHSR